LATVLFVAWGLYAAQLASVRASGPMLVLTYPATIVRSDTYGWPVFFVTRHENVFRARIPVYHYEFAYRALAVDAGTCLAIMAATIYIARRALWSGWRFRLSSLFAVTTAVAVMLAWWRIEGTEWYMHNEPDLTRLLQSEVGTPLLRLLEFSPFIYVPVLFGIGCLVICAMLILGAAARFAVRGMSRRAPIQLHG
jgi:hypothetical protein